MWSGDDGSPTFRTFAMRFSGQLYNWVSLLVDPDVALTVSGMRPHPDDIDLLLTTLSEDPYVPDFPCEECNGLAATIQVIGVSTPKEVVGVDLLVVCECGSEIIL